MEIAPLSLSSLEARDAEDQADVVLKDAGLVEARIRMSRVFFESHGSEKNHRPYLHGLGELIALQAIEEADGTRERNRFGYGVDRLNFEGADRPQVSMLYEFTDEQLVELTRKGFFHRGYSAPDSLETVFELPVQAQWMTISPDYLDEGSFPLVFTSVEGLAHLDMTQEISGYDLVAEMPDQSMLHEVHGPDLQPDQDYVAPGDELFAGQDLFTAEPDVSVDVPRIEQPSDDRGFEDALDAQRRQVQAEDPTWLDAGADEDFDPDIIEDDTFDLDELGLPAETEQSSTTEPVSEPESVDDDFEDIEPEDVIEFEERPVGLSSESVETAKTQKARTQTVQREQSAQRGQVEDLLDQVTHDDDDEMEL